MTPPPPRCAALGAPRARVPGPLARSGFPLRLLLLLVWTAATTQGHPRSGPRISAVWKGRWRRAAGGARDRSLGDELPNPRTQETQRHPPWPSGLHTVPTPPLAIHSSRCWLCQGDTPLSSHLVVLSMCQRPGDPLFTLISLTLLNSPAFRPFHFTDEKAEARGKKLS